MNTLHNIETLCTQSSTVGLDSFCAVNTVKNIIQQPSGRESALNRCMLKCPASRSTDGSIAVGLITARQPYTTYRMGNGSARMAIGERYFRFHPWLRPDSNRYRVNLISMKMNTAMGLEGQKRRK